MMTGFAWNLLSFVLALGILIFVHEFGHFYIARRNGIKVLRFAIGFGKPLISWHDKKGTEYTIGLIPLGGYVRMLDERVDEVPEQQRQFSFNSKSVGQRIAVVSAGPLANFIFAVIALVAMYLIGVPAVKPVVGDVTKDSVAYQAGLEPLDEVLAINGEAVSDWEAASYALLDSVGQQTLTLSILRAETQQDIRVNIEGWQVVDGQLFDGLGFTPYRPAITTTLGHIVENSAAERAGLQVGDRILALGGMPVSDWQQASDIIVNRPGEPLEVEIERQGQVLILQAQVDNRQTADGFSSGFLGVAPVQDNWPKGYVFEHQYGIFPALHKALDKTLDLIGLSFRMIGKLVVGDLGLENLSGPISIAQGAGTSAQGGLVYFLSFLALISINLGVINLLPLPILDGGHLMYFIIELIRKKPVSEKVQEVGFRIGAFVLMMLMGIAILNDITRL